MKTRQEIYYLCQWPDCKNEATARATVTVSTPEHKRAVRFCCASHAAAWLVKQAMPRNAVDAEKEKWIELQLERIFAPQGV